MYADGLGLIGGQLLSVLPSLTGWTAAVVVAVLLKMRGGGTPVTLLLIGSSILLLAAVLRVPAGLVVPFLVLQHGWAAPDAAGAIALVGLAIESLKLGGIICLVIAFWQQFREAGVARQNPTDTSVSPSVSGTETA